MYSSSSNSCPGGVAAPDDDAVIGDVAAPAAAGSAAGDGAATAWSSDASLIGSVLGGAGVLAWASWCLTAWRVSAADKACAKRLRLHNVVEPRAPLQSTLASKAEIINLELGIARELGRRGADADVADVNDGDIADVRNNERFIISFGNKSL